LKAINPLFYFFIFLYATVVLPIIINGFKIVNLWYAPLSDTGQATFIYPFLTFVVFSLSSLILIGYFLYRRKGSRFILVRGPMRLRSVIKAIMKDNLGRTLIIIYSILYIISFMITSGLLLIPGINIDSYFVKLTLVTYEGSGINVIALGNFYLIINYLMIVFGIFIDLLLSISLILSYYIISLIYVSYNIYSFPVPKNFRIYGMSTVGGFLTASVPSIGTIAGICCLTPTALNSLLYLASSSLPLTKGIAWKYGTFILGAWTGGLLQALTLVSPVILGGIIIGVSVYYVYLISKRINKVMIGE